MRVSRKALVSIAVTAAVAAGPAGAAAAPPGHVLLRPVALRLGPPPDFELIGRGGEAGSRWSRDSALDGSFSIRAEIAPDPLSGAAAGAEVMGVAGRSVSDLGTLGFSVAGSCSEISPRFIVFFDSTGDGAEDGSAIYGCNAAGVAAPGWTSVRTDALAPDFVVMPAPAPRFGPSSTVIGVLLIADTPGVHHLDRIELAGATVGEPGGR